MRNKIVHIKFEINKYYIGYYYYYYYFWLSLCWSLCKCTCVRIDMPSLRSIPGSECRGPRRVVHRVRYRYPAHSWPGIWVDILSILSHRCDQRQQKKPKRTKRKNNRIPPSGQHHLHHTPFPAGGSGAGDSISVPLLPRHRFRGLDYCSVDQIGLK